MDDAADYIESGGASLKAVKREPVKLADIASGNVHLVTAGPNLEAMSIIADCQKLLATYLEPGGPDMETTITALLGILDGPRAHALQGRGR